MSSPPLWSRPSPVCYPVLQRGVDGCLANLGICGRLGDLASIDKAYDVPISTASGAWGDLVVETTEGGQRVIEWLKREKVGKIRCIILEKLQYTSNPVSYGL